MTLTCPVLPVMGDGLENVPPAPLSVKLTVRPEKAVAVLVGHRHDQVFSQLIVHVGALIVSLDDVDRAGGPATALSVIFTEHASIRGSDGDGFGFCGKCIDDAGLTAREL